MIVTVKNKTIITTPEFINLMVQNEAIERIVFEIPNTYKDTDLTEYTFSMDYKSTAGEGTDSLSITTDDNYIYALWKPTGDGALSAAGELQVQIVATLENSVWQTKPAYIDVAREIVLPA